MIFTEMGLHKMLIIASAYFLQDSKKTPPKQTRQTNYCKTRRFPLVMGCEVMNREENTSTFHSWNRVRAIDLTLCSGNLMLNIEKYEVCQKLSLLNHMTMKFELETDLKSKENCLRNPNKPNWNGYRNHLREKLKDFLWEINDGEILNSAEEELNEDIMEDYEMYGTCWWNEKLQKRVSS